MESSLEDRLCLTYARDTDERDEERGDHDEEREELSVFVQKLEFVDESRDHRLHPSHLKKQHSDPVTALTFIRTERCVRQLPVIIYSNNPHSGPF